MTELQRIEFAAAAMACKRMGLMSHSASSSPTGQAAHCSPGRIRHSFGGFETCAHCGATKAQSKKSPTHENRLTGFDLS
jgi:hypothetical protein